MWRKSSWIGKQMGISPFLLLLGSRSMAEMKWKFLSANNKDCSVPVTSVDENRKQHDKHI
jgi:hypothetical protein